MNKPALKRLATEARRELLDRVELQARKIGVTAEGIQKAQFESSDAIFIDGKQLSEKERVQRNKLIVRIRDIGFNRVMEETAYTWFNRFIALRFMEVNDYLPTKVRVLSSANTESTDPDMMKEALSLELDLDKEYVYDLKMNNKDEELFKYLIIKHCNDLNRYMPFMFETIEDYTEVLFPEGLLGTDSFVRRMTDLSFIPESNWENIEVVGWLYQYYIAEEKDRVFKQKTKYKAEEIPYATQLFTPDWIVKYMVQNSLGRYWVEAHPEHRNLQNKWEFFLEHEEESFQQKIEPYVNKELNVEDIKCLDPAMGSGHILIYMFDVLFEIYSKCGYVEREIPQLIIENNLYGLDIDDRAFQLASFSIVMKAMQYNRRFLKGIERNGLSLNLASIQETNGWSQEVISFIAKETKGENFNFTEQFIEQFHDAKTFGSLLKVQEMDFSFLKNRLKEVQSEPVSDIFHIENRDRVLALLPRLIKQASIMSRQYDIVVMNPPYMGSRSMNKELSSFLSKHYPDSKSDLFAAFMEVNHYLKENSFYACINQHSWMFLASYEKLRAKIINRKFIDSMLHLGPRAFEEIGGEVVQSTTFVLRNYEMPELESIFVKLTEERTAKEKNQNALLAAKDGTDIHRFQFFQKNFGRIASKPIAYWISEKMFQVFNQNKSLSHFAEPRKGLTTGDNERFVRLWYEISKSDFAKFYSSSKWVPMTKGGDYRRWYGNNEYVINWENEGYELKNFKDNSGKLKSVLRNTHFYYRECISWNDTTSGGRIGFRFQPEGFIPNASGPCVYSDENLFYYFGLLNSKVTRTILEVLAPTLKFEVGQISLVPIIKQEDKRINELVSELVEIAKENWDSFELSWDFKKHPYLLQKGQSKTIEGAFKSWAKNTGQLFLNTKNKEEELNEKFIDIYNLQSELTHKIEEKDITIRKANIVRDSKSFLSYMIGCCFGRYSLDEEGLIYAGGEFVFSRYNTFSADSDNIIPILSTSYFEDDTVTKFIDFTRVTFGEETVEDNLDFIADAIGRKKNETAREALRRYFLNDFYRDHVQVYKQRPIYWLFTSGKEKAFNCLVYIHRYDKTTLSRIRTDYLHEIQTRMDSEKKDLLQVIEGNTTPKEISIAKKELKTIDKKIEELKAYDEKLHHMADMQIEIDLDDGVAVNYAKFEGLVAKI